MKKKKLESSSIINLSGDNLKYYISLTQKSTTRNFLKGKCPELPGIYTRFCTV